MADAPFLDAEAVAQAFPLLAQELKRPLPLAYLDNAATTQKPACVLAAQDRLYCTANANPLRGRYPLGQQATQCYEDARKTVARFVGAADDEVAFTGGATESLNTVAYAYGMHALVAGDEIVLGVAEHHSNLVPWQTVAELTGARLVYVLPDERGVFAADAWQRAIGPRTRIVAVAHVSNVLGTVAPLSDIARAAHEAGAVVVADCAQSVAHLPLDLHGLDVDFAAFSAHKLYGPLGLGVLYGKRELLERMPPLMRGGGMVDTVFETRATFADVPARFEAGTPNVGGAAGLAEAVRFVGRIGFDAIREHESRLIERLLNGLASLPDVVVHGDARPSAARGDAPVRCGVVSFNVRGMDANDTADVLARENIAIRSGAHCAEPIVRHLGQRATCRASVALYNTESDVDRLLEAVESAKRKATFMIMSSLL